MTQKIVPGLELVSVCELTDFGGAQLFQLY